MSVWIATYRAVLNNTSKALVESVRCYMMPCQPSDWINGRFNLYRIRLFQTQHSGQWNNGISAGYRQSIPMAIICARDLTQTRKRVRECRQAGVLLEAIASEFDISIYTASEWCKGIKVDKETVRGTAAKKRAEKAARKQQARTRRKEGAKIETIATEFRISISTASEWCKGIR